MLRLHQVVQALGERKIINTAVTQGQLLHSLHGDWLRNPGSNVQDQEFDLQFIMNE